MNAFKPSMDTAPKGDGTQAGVPRNFQILPPLDFLAEFTQHIPPKGSHLIRYYGWYSNKSRGMRKKTEVAASEEPLAEETTTSRSSQAWAMLIKRVYEVDPLSCPECGGQMKVVSFSEPPQAPASIVLASLPCRLSEIKFPISKGLGGKDVLYSIEFEVSDKPIAK